MATYEWTQDAPIRRSGPVYVVCKANGDAGPFTVFRDGYMHRESDYRGEWECSCGNKADTRGHFVSKREAERHARELNAPAPVAGLSATTQALRRLGHSYRCIADARGVSTRTVWLALSARPESSGRTPWARRGQAERDCAIAAAFDLLSQHECRCATPPEIPAADAREPGEMAWGA